MKNANSPGLTLIEMAIILIILGLLFGMTFPLLSELTKHRHFRSTQKDLEEIKQALLGYAGIYHRLPCADGNGDGVGDCGGTPTVTGTLPYLDLGLGAVDAWRNAFHYDVNSRLVSTSTQTAFCTALSSIVSGEDPRLAFASGGTPVSQAFVVISKGENSTLDGGNTNYADRDYESFSPTETFDDVVAALSPNALYGNLNCGGSGGGLTCSTYTVVNRWGNDISVTGGAYSTCTTIANGASFIINTGETIIIYNNSTCAGVGSSITFNNAASADADGDCLVRWTSAGGGSLADE